MELKFFSIPARDPSMFEEELNQFLRSCRVLTVQHELVREESGSWWAVCVEFLAVVNEKTSSSPGKPKVDYRELLNEADFATFSKLRQLRKEIAEKDAIPVYAVFTNEQLAAMVTDQVGSLAGLRRIDGIGEGRVEKYGQSFIDLLHGCLQGVPAETETETGIRTESEQ